MSRIFITGSTQGLGLMTAQLLADEDHAVTLHARDQERADDARRQLPEAEGVLVADLSTVAAMRGLAEQANRPGRFDAVVHNVGISYREPRRVETADGLSQLWAVNVLAPYVLTALMHRPGRLVYLSSGMHTGGDARLEDVQWAGRRWNGSQAYADTKLHDVLLAFGVARRWPGVAVNAVSPGWVPTRMGGSAAPDDLDREHRTQAWLAAGDSPEARETGRFLYHRAPGTLNPVARDEALQDRLLALCRDLSGAEIAETCTETVA